MASEWFYQAMGEQVGPISSAELLALAQHGTIVHDTPVRKDTDGKWVSAGLVKGLFAVPNGPPPVKAATGTIQSSSSDTAAAEESSGLGTATKISLLVGGVVCILTIGFLVWFFTGRDTWERDNTSRVSVKLEEADRLQQSDPFTAYKAYDEVLKETKQHKIADWQFAEKLANAEKSRTALYPKVEEKIQAEEAEKRRLTEEKAKLAAEEKQRAAEEENRKKTALEAQKIAEEKRQAEEKRIKDAIAVYRNVSQSAQNALNAVKKLEARTEVGISYNDYSTVVGEAWADVKIFAESPEGKKLPEFSFLLISAMGKYKLALDVWLVANRYSLQRGHENETMYLLTLPSQYCWRAAHRRVKMAESLITEQDTATVLLGVTRLEKTDAVYDEEILLVLDDLGALWDSAGLNDERIKKFRKKLDDIDKEDKERP